MIDYIFNSIDPEISEKYNLRPAVGLAAPQVGHNIKMLVIYCFDEVGKEHFYPMINLKHLKSVDLFISFLLIDFLLI